MIKKSNVEILEIWRKIGFLEGLKKGSQNEWRCAKSFDLMANYLVGDGKVYGDNNIITEIVFPLIRRIICTGNIRLNCIVEPQIIFKSLKKITLQDCFDEIGSKKMNNEKRLVFRILKNFSIHEGLLNKNIIDLTNTINNISNEDKMKSDFEFMNILFGSKIDYEGEILCFVSDILVKQIKNDK